jgi:hypothetical protein
VDQGIVTPDVGLSLIRALGKGFTCGVSLKMVRRRRWIFYLRVFSSRIIEFSEVDPIRSAISDIKDDKMVNWRAERESRSKFPE